MTPHDYHAALRRALDDNLVSAIEQVVGGGIKSFDDYRFLTGQIRAFRADRELVTATYNKMFSEQPIAPKLREGNKL